MTFHSDPVLVVPALTIVVLLCVELGSRIERRKWNVWKAAQEQDKLKRRKELADMLDKFM